MDVVADVLALSGVRGTLGARVEAGGTWGVRWAESAEAGFYAVTGGAAWLTVPTGGREPVQLLPGDVVLLPRGAAHTLSSVPGADIHACDVTAAARARAEGGVLRLGDGEVRTRILGATYRQDPAVRTPLLTLLPEVVHIAGEGLGDTVRLLARELTAPGIASAVVLDRLVDVLLVQLLRVWLDSRPGEIDGCWLGALNDPIMTEALGHLHRRPSHPWTTAELAAELSVSRATLARRFQSVIGQSPGTYLTRWRMDLAARRLRDTDDPIDSIARAVGYTSVYAFNRAFHRSRAEPPGRYRLTARAAAQPVTDGAQAG
ncbi:AraC family transcriptional regulator [Actinoplanes couchii]|nr:AraC family transcriptional regulator [Actinoplanes couchii]MDR6317128.1 AraC-like DNA-binding protein [Actinoplanes couchii]